MTVVLRVMSGMDPHMIRVTRMGGLDVEMVGQSILLGRTAIVDFVVGSMSRFEKNSL
jgi:hypothetical protein